MQGAATCSPWVAMETPFPLTATGFEMGLHGAGQGLYFENVTA